MNRSLVSGCALAVVVALGASCGVPTGADSFEAIPGEDLPDRLVDETTTTTTTTTTTIPPTTTTPLSGQTETTVPTTTAPPVPTEAVPVFFLSRGELTSIDVTAPVGPEPNDLILLLEAGPEGPLAGLLDNLIEPELIVTTSRQRGVITVELDETLFRRISRLDQRAAIGQIVLTFLNSLSGVGQVVFSIDDTPLRVPTEDGDFTDEPVALDDYDDLLVDRDEPPPESTTTTTTSTTTTTTSTTTTTTTTLPEPEPSEASEPATDE